MNFINRERNQTEVKLKEKDPESKRGKTKPGMMTITPKRDFTICHNDFYQELKKGKECDLPDIYIPNMKTEKVI